MPSGNVKNYIYKGEGQLRFSDQTGTWISDKPLISNGAAWADLDNDGDLDLVTNNLHGPAGLYRNDATEKGSFLKLKVQFAAPNTFGIGTKVIAWHQGQMQLKQLFTSRGFQSSSEPILHFGFSEATDVDTLLTTWPYHTYLTLYMFSLNQTLEQIAAAPRIQLDYNVL